LQRDRATLGIVVDVIMYCMELAVADRNCYECIFSFLDHFSTQRGRTATKFSTQTTLQGRLWTKFGAIGVGVTPSHAKRVGIL